MEIYKHKFNFDTASIMDYNMKYDHDDIAKNHNMPQVAFMINPNFATQEVTLKEFNKEQYDEALDYRNSFIKNLDTRYKKYKPKTEETKKEHKITKLTNENATLSSDLKGKKKITNNFRNSLATNVRALFKIISNGSIVILILFYIEKGALILFLFYPKNEK